MLRKLPQKKTRSLDLCGAQNERKGMEGLQGEHSNVFPLSLSLLPMLLCEYLQIHGSLLATELDPFLTPLSSGHLFCFSSSSLRLWAIILSPQLRTQNTTYFSPMLSGFLAKVTLG